MQGPNCTAAGKRECAGSKILDRLEHTATEANDTASRVLDRLSGVVSTEEALPTCPGPIPNYPYPPYFSHQDDLISRINESLASINRVLDRLELP